MENIRFLIFSFSTGSFCFYIASYPFLLLRVDLLSEGEGDSGMLLSTVHPSS